MFAPIFNVKMPSVVFQVKKGAKFSGESHSQGNQSPHGAKARLVLFLLSDLEETLKRLYYLYLWLKIELTGPLALDFLALKFLGMKIKYRCRRISG